MRVSFSLFSLFNSDFYNVKMSRQQRKRRALVELDPNLVDGVNIDSKRTKRAESGLLYLTLDFTKEIEHVLVLLFLEREIDNSQDQPSISHSLKRRSSEQDHNVSEIATKRSKNDEKG